MEIDLGDELVVSRPGDEMKFGNITADAFRDDPLNNWMFEDFAGISALFHWQAKHIYVPRGYCYRAGDDGACMWMMPDGDHSVTKLAELKLAFSIIMNSSFAAMKRAWKVGEEMARAHPRFTHAYLFSIGVRPMAQGKGLGRKLIQPVLDACDRDGIPAYLENSNAANTGFYNSCGFEQTGFIKIDPDAPPLVPMLRKPRS
ncbi:GNAT family N-acetyltransferase [Altererythrobacter sp. MF3-039]|uniref:GNAT family N-acetyltransferase n=1 Tax=Altererythrobacter sp. MF3-039 TaxID=3252901 RepID=UPI00390C51CB